MILSGRAEFELARRLRGKCGAPIAEVFTFLSGLYFRGKIAYATAFARPQTGTPGVFVITPTRGLVDAIDESGLPRTASTGDSSISMTCVNSQRLIFRVMIRVFERRLNETRVVSQKNCQLVARSSFSAALLQENM